MSEFTKFSAAVHARYAEMQKSELYTVDVEDIFQSYLGAFPEGSNPLFRERTEHDCNCCKQFIRRLGIVVGFDDNLNRMTVWDDWESLPHPYNTVGRAMRLLIMQAPIRDLFRSKERQYSHEKNADNHDNLMWHHFYGRVADKHYSNKPSEVIGSHRTKVQVLKRGLEELTAEAFETVVDLVNSNSLYRGEEHLRSIKDFQTMRNEYENTSDKNAFLWLNATRPIAQFRNTVIGTLLVDLSNSVPLEDAVRMFESKVAPQNYKRTSALITPKMIENAVNKLKTLGLDGAVHRRYARLSDVSVNNVLWVDRTQQSKMKDSLTSLLMPATASASSSGKLKNILDQATIMDIDTFFNDILPTASAMELYVENRHQGNFMALTTSDDPAPLFQWDNPCAWSYDGDVTDSIKEKVKRAGGNINAPLRVSLGWFNSDDLDIHCHGPEGHIHFGNKFGVLDVDMNAYGAQNSKDPVENLSWMKPKNGNYSILVHQFTKRNTSSEGFTIELWNNNRSQFFDFKQDIRPDQIVPVMTFTIKNGIIQDLKVEGHMIGSTNSNSKWGIETEKLIPVDTLMYSPNRWDGQTKGNLHWFFMLRGCNNPEPIRGFYNEFLRPDLIEHRKVFEVLGSKTKCEPIPDSLCGVGFSSTRHDNVTVVVTTDKGKQAFNLVF